MTSPSRRLLAFALCLLPSLASAKTLYVNAATGNDATTYADNGIGAPWQTIGRAAWGSTNRAAPNTSEAAQAGDIVSIAAGTYASGLGPASAPARYNVLYNPANSGTIGNVITFDAAGVVVIQATAWAGPAIGAYGKDYIHWTGPFDIDEVDILTTPDTGPVVFNDTDGSGIDGATIHGAGSLWADNHNGVRLDVCAQCFVRNTTIDHFYHANPTSHNGSCITTYGTTDIIIEHNRLTDCGAGIYQKASLDMMIAQTGGIIRFNLIEDMLSIGILIIEQNGADIYQNIVAGTPDGIGWFGLDDSMMQDFQNGRWVNNTVYGLSAAGVYLSQAGYLNVTLQNNIFSTVRDGVYSEDVTEPGAELASNRNVWHSLSRRMSTLVGTNQATLANWQSAYSQDANSITTDPTFVNAAGGDFHLQGGSDALTLGVDILDLDGDLSTVDTVPAGAYVLGTETIGPVAADEEGSTPTRIPVPGLRIKG